MYVQKGKGIKAPGMIGKGPMTEPIIRFVAIHFAPCPTFHYSREHREFLTGVSSVIQNGDEWLDR